MAQRSHHIADKDIDTYRAAYLSSKGHSQVEIGHLLNLGQATIHRRLLQARELDLIGEKRPLWTGSAAALRAVEQLIGTADELLDRFNKLSDRSDRLLDLRILDNPHEPGRPKHREFARHAARYLLDGRLHPDNKIGCAWGGLLLSVAEEVERLRDRPRSNWSNIAFMPICGDTPEVFSTPMRSAANIAAHLDRALADRTVSEYTFSSVAGCIPQEFNGARAETLREFFQTIPGYRKVFGVDPTLGAGRRQRKKTDRKASTASEEGVIAQLDGVLTSLATNDVKNRWLVAAATAARVEPSELAAACPGNVGGIFLNHPRPTAKQKRIVSQVTARWTGKALIAIECVRRGLVNRLLLDRDTANAVSRALDALEGKGDSGVA